MIKIQPKIAVRKVTPSSTKIGKLIAWWCKCKYYHIELILDNKWLSADPDNGVYWNVEPPEDHLDYDIFELPTVSIDKKVYENIKMFIEQQTGPKYDTLGLIWNQLIGWNVYSQDRWYCSEIMVIILQYLGYYKFYGYNGNELSPQDIYDIVISEEEYPNIEVRRHSIINRVKRLYKKLKKWTGSKITYLVSWCKKIFKK